MTQIQIFAANVLKEHGCDCYTYGDKDEPYCQISSIVDELKEAYPDGMEFSYEDVAQAILDMSKPRNPKPEVECDYFDFEDWGKWGVGDFYEGPEKILREVLRSGKTFDTGWHGFREEIESFRVQKTESEVIVSCSSSIDEIFEQWDLFCDFLTDDEMKMLNDEIVEEIRSFLMNGDFSEESVCTESLPANADFDSIMAAASDLIRQCHGQDKEHFREAIATTLYVLYEESEDAEKLIDERCKECNCLE